MTKHVSVPDSSLARGLFATASAAVAVLVLAACGSGGQDQSQGEGHGSGHDSGKKPSKSAGAADVSFAKGMIPHHRQALEMSGLASSRAESAQVKALAERISKAQEPEIDKLSGWLKSWGEKVPAANQGHSGHSGHSMAGMMTPEDMAKLKKMSGEKFDREFLKMMTAHHEGAVDMARTEESDGSYRPAKEMAREIRRSQTGEIKEMRGLLKK
ncbi:copper resistance protein [Streptomyces nanshensis]|nr:copper resistance protein [Streptomyces nanshensis]